MCGRYYIDIDESEIREIAKEVESNLTNKDIKTGEIYPTNKVPILTEQCAQVMEWGFPNFKSSGVIINARAETALEKRTFKDAVLSRRCVVLSSGFYEWKENGTKKKDKYYFTMPNFPVMYMAGLYTPYDKDGEKINKFVISTTAANASMADVHNRMPVILQKENLYRWLGDTDYALEVLRQTSPELLRALV